MDRDEMLKIAYMRGVATAAEGYPGLVKEAIVGNLLGLAGKGIAKGVGKMLGSPKATSRMMHFGKGGTKGSLAGGTLTGGINALGAPEGERGEAFARGFLPGAISFGPAWQLSSRLGRLAGKKGLSSIAGGGAQGARVVGRAVRRAKSPVFTQKRFSNLWRSKADKLAPKRGTPMMKQFGQNPVEGFKTLGSKTLLSAMPFGAALYGSTLAEKGVGAITRKSPTPPMSTPGAAAIYHTGRQAMGRGYGFTPQTQNYGYYGQYR
ncbi:MAG: hypothetical protein DRP01_03700 [Archaeoglobales archaeon]|nr:MAG: hypothetical protein DRP01_03700 [Archaeoglobales archaeon]